MRTRINSSLALQRSAHETFEVFERIELGLSWKSQTAPGIEVVDWRALNPADVVKSRPACSREFLLENIF
jgi:hypothetical protein